MVEENKQKKPLSIVGYGIMALVEMEKDKTQNRIFEELEKAKKPMSLMDLSRAVGKSKTNIDFHIRKLEKAGFLIITKSKKQKCNPLLISINYDKIKELDN